MNFYSKVLIILLLALTVNLQCKVMTNEKLHSLVKKNMISDKQKNNITQKNLDKSFKFSHLLQTVVTNNEEEDSSVGKSQPSTVVFIISVVGGTAIVSVLIFVLYKRYKKWVIESTNQKNIKEFLSQAKYQMEQECKFLGVENYDVIRKKSQSNFIQSITKIKYTKISNETTKIVAIGPISSGKSSLLNKLLETKQEVGVGQTTKQMKLVYQNYKTEVYDSPGINKNYDIFDYIIFNGLLIMDTFLVCYQNCLPEVNVLIRVLSAIRIKCGQKIYLVRTQCDRFDKSDERTLAQEIQKDRQYLKLMQSRESFVGNYPILATSAKKNLHFADNNKVKRILKGQDLEI